MKKNAEKKRAGEGGVEAVPLLVGLAGFVQGELREFVARAGLVALSAMLEQDRVALCGPRYQHNEDRVANRAGYAQGELVLGGRRVSVRRPRVRGITKEEIVLPSWKRFSNEDPLNERAVEQMLIGVSTRKYERSLEPVGAEVKTRGTSKSAVSRRFVEITEKQVDEWLHQDLSTIDLVALMIDGIVIDGHVMLVALGIDADATKHVLGLHEGATENAVSCKALLSDLQARGLRTDRHVLVVIDGGKALASGVRQVFGKRAIVQRCQVHKARNVLEHLPDKQRNTALRAMRAAYGCGDHKRAKTLLEKLARSLEKHHPGAAASLREGLDETLTVMQLDLCRDLERTLSTTNAIENLMSSIRTIAGRVKRWQDGAMIERWTGAALIEASKKFRRLRGCTGIKKLVDVLRKRDRSHGTNEVDSNEQAA